MPVHSRQEAVAAADGSEQASTWLQAQIIHQMIPGGWLKLQRSPLISADRWLLRASVTQMAHTGPLADDVMRVT